MNTNNICVLVEEYVSEIYNFPQRENTFANSNA